MQYSSKVLDHFHNPRGAGVLADSPEVITRRSGQHSQGQVLQLQIKLVNGSVVDARFKAYGDVALIACASFWAEWVLGKQLEEAAQCTCQFLMEQLELPLVKRHTALFVADTWQELASISG